MDDFASLKLPAFLSRNIDLMRYRKPTPIQKHAVPLALAGSDLMCCAQTGSGKTAAFLVPICAALHADGATKSTVGTGGAAKPRAVVMAPTRELAMQIELEAEKLTNRSNLRAVVVYGGADQKAQVRALCLGVDVVVATPGRLNDFVERGIVDLSTAAFLVLDEADRMLDMGFEPQIRRARAATTRHRAIPRRFALPALPRATPLRNLTHTRTQSRRRGACYASYQRPSDAALLCDLPGIHSNARQGVFARLLLDWSGARWIDHNEHRAAHSACDGG